MEKTCLLAVALLCGLAWMTPADGATVYNNLTPNNQMAIASRPGSTGSFEIEAADDFNLSSSSLITSASFVGLVVGGATSPSITDMVLEMYRVFPLDSDPTRTPNVPTRTNSPSDVAFDSRDASSGLTFTTTVLSNSFTALNSVQPGGIHAKPNQTTLENGSVTGQEVRFDVTLVDPFSLPGDDFFFIPQVSVSGGQFYWLSASRPITGSGTTPFKPDLQGVDARCRARSRLAACRYRHRGRHTSAHLQCGVFPGGHCCSGARQHGCGRRRAGSDSIRHAPEIR